MTSPNISQMIGMRVFQEDEHSPQTVRFCPLAQKIQALAIQFSTIKNPDGIFPWDVEYLATEAIHKTSSSARQAVLFILSVWDPDAPELYHHERFDVHHALKIWDEQNRRAFLKWAMNPWWA